DLVDRDVRPSAVITRESLENAVRTVVASGGTTNAILHLLAVAREAGVAFTIDDFETLSAATPVLADLKPGGRYFATDLHEAGGVRLLGKRLLDAGLLHGDAITVSGHTVAEELADAEE